MCGPELRDELIRKWNGLGNDYYTDKNEIYRKNDRATAFINDIVKKSLIPAYPFFVISMLQGMEAAEAQNPEYSIHGYYYQLIINKALAKAISKTKELGAFHSIITQYCYFLFAEKIRFKSVPLDDFRTFYSDFCKRFEIETISLDRALDVLVKGKLITVAQDQVRIAYKYVYYYHVAKYLSEKIATVPEIKEKVRQMCERVYREEYSNIVMFLVHLEKSQLILDELLINAKQIFKNFPAIRLEEDTDFINKLIDRIPEEILEHSDEEDARKEDLKEEEKQEQLEREFEEDDITEGDYSLDEDIAALEIMPRLNRAVKTIEILGQVTKKHWAEIEGPKKLELAEETFLVGLRTLGFHFDLLEKNIEILVEHVKEIVERKHLKDSLDKIELKHITNGLIFRLCSLSSYGIFRRVSNSIGLEDLAPTFKRLEEKLSYKSVQLINLSIKLEHYRSFPENDLNKFQESNGTNFLCINVMQNMIVNYMYLYHTTDKKKQQLCAKFKIAMPKQRKIEATSKVRKSSK